MGIKLETQQIILDKAKTKKDGCYRFRGVAYRVRNGNVTHLAHFGDVFECVSGFNVFVGRYTHGINSDEAGQRFLKQL